MASRVFHLVGARVVVTSAVPAVVGAWLFNPLVGLGIGTGMFVFEIWRLRRMVLQAMPETLTFAAAHPSEHDWLDRAGFERELAELRSLGFVPIADYTLSFPNVPDGFARLLVHPGHRLYAEVNQLNHTDHTDVTTTIASAMTEGWGLQTSSRPAITTFAAFMCTPRKAWDSRAGSRPAELLDRHLETRAEICRMQGVTVTGDGSVQGYLDAEQTAHAARRDGLTWIRVLFGLGRGIRAERRPVERWLGGIRPGAADLST